jgi:hypothetical protein
MLAAWIEGATPPVIKTTIAMRRERRNTADTLETFAAFKRQQLPGKRSMKRVTRSLDFPATLAHSPLACIERLDAATLSTNQHDHVSQLDEKGSGLWLW